MSARRGPSRTVAAAAAAMVLASCSQATSAPEPSPTATAGSSPPVEAVAPPGTFYAYSSDIRSLDPGSAVDEAELTVVDRVFDSLTEAGPDTRIRPSAAARWESNPEATRWVFRLRPDATFHDGSPVAASDFVRAWQRLITGVGGNPSPVAQLLAPVAGFEAARETGVLSGARAVDAHTLDIQLTQPLADFPAVVSHPALAPVPESADGPSFAARPIGNGPFELAEPWQRGEYVRLGPFADHPDAPEVAQIVYRIYSGDDAVVRAYEDFERGSLDDAPVPEGRAAEAERTYSVIDSPRLTTAFYGFNTRVAPFDDPAVRRALASLIDREALAARLGEDGRTVTDAVVPPGLPDHEPAPCAFCTYDPDRAAELLGERVLEPVELVYYQDDEHQAIAEQVQRTVNTALGPGTLTLRPLRQAEWLEAVRSGEAGFFLSGWLAEYPAADSFLYPMFHSSRIGLDNVTGYANPEVDELLALARATLDPARRAALYRDVETIVLRDMPVVPLFHYRQRRVISDRVSGFQVNAMGDVDMTTVRVTATRE